jgi:DNA-directed RNA polymerase I subunit RPA2
MEAKKGQKIPSYSDKPLDEPTMRRLEHLVSAHVDSFNYFLRSGLEAAVEDLTPMEMTLQSNGRGNGPADTPGFAPHVQLYFSSLNVATPSRRDGVSDGKITPREARERHITYNGLISGVMHAVVEIDNGSPREFEFPVKFGVMPLMVMSEKCHLRGSNSTQLVALGEEATEVGGYFILNGIERVIRLLQVPRRNHAMAIERGSYKNRGNLYSDKGVAMRCVRGDQTGVTITLHYLTNGNATVKFVLRKQEFLVPLIIVARALCEISDKEFFSRVLQGDTENTFVSTRLELLLRDAKKHSLPYQAQCLAYLGSHFRAFLPVSSRTSDEEAGMLLIRKYFFVHVDTFDAKFECLLHMIRKLFCFAEGRCAQDNADVLMNHELLLPGHLLTMILKEKLEDVLILMKTLITKDYIVNRGRCLADMNTATYFQKMADKCSSGVGRKIETFLSTGNLVTSTGLDLQQVSGFTIVAERLNIFRYMSHFQSVHRGQFFTTMKTTSVRKLFPESWGFLCPVHTPDGSPCGLLNHLAKEAVIMSFSAEERLPTTPLGPLSAGDGKGGTKKWATGKQLLALLVSLGVLPGGKGSADGQQIVSAVAKGVSVIPVLIDGASVGGLPSNIAATVVAQLRYLKVVGGGSPETCLDPTMELAYLPPAHSGLDAKGGGVFPGLYIFTQPGRLIRPVTHLKTRLTEWVGPMEQVFMDIACLNEDVREGLTSHVEISPDVVLSQVAFLTPFSDYNQSPRNMYQCQVCDSLTD